MCTHSNTHRFVKLTAEHCFPVRKLIGGLCVCVVMSFKDKRWIQGNTLTNTYHHSYTTNMGFSIIFAMFSLC